MTGPEPAGEAGKLGDDAQAVLQAARDTARAYTGALRSLRELFAAEVGLARDALVKALVLLLLAIVMVATAYGLLTALLVAGIRSLGAPWPLAIFIPLLLSLGLAWLGVRQAQAALRHADFDATRRQLKRGLEDAAPVPAPADEATP